MNANPASAAQEEIVIPIMIMMFILAFCHSSNAGILVQNSRKDIDACKGNLDLRLLRTWGGQDEQDENKFFKTPISVAIDKNNLVYICDMHDNCVRIFSGNGEYVRTIGRRGQGPGDLLGPGKATMAPNGDLLIFEYEGFRLQRFGPDGNSKRITIIPKALGWIGITSKNEIAFYSWLNTFRSKRIISFIDETGKTIKEIGYHEDHSNNYIDSEKLMIAMDNKDHFYVANKCTPVIRKYTPKGELQMAVTFETPFPIEAQIKMNSAETEIEINRADEGTRTLLKKDSSGNVLLDKRGKLRPTILNGIGVDDKSRIYVVTPRRILSEEENLATRISGGVDGINRKLVNSEITENIDLNRLLVFDENGKICAASSIKGLCDDIYINGNKLFIIDGYIDQRILEFEMMIK